MAFPYWPPKDPDEILDYQVDWTDRLSGDTIATSSWIAPVGITVVSNTNSTTSATIWLSGGTLDEIYAFTNRITTAAGRTMDQTMRLKIKAK